MSKYINDVSTVHCDCVECKSGRYNQEDFFIQPKDWSKKNYKNGLSGILRAKNEAEFIELAIKTCINALDELVIVVQQSSDNTLEIAKKYQTLYPKKIKLFEYPINIDNPLYYERNQANIDRSLYHKRAYTVHGAANYYNFTQSKVSYKYTIKIDADHLHIQDKLNFVRKCYKNNKFIIFGHFLKSIFRPRKIKYLLALYKLIKNNTDQDPFYSGLNTYKYNNDIYCVKTPFMTFRQDNNQPVAVRTFAGLGDSLIYLSNNHYYILNEEHLYEQLHPHPYPKMFSIGFLFVHLHGLRSTYYERVKLINIDMKEEFANNFSSLMKFTDYVNLTYQQMAQQALKTKPDNHVFESVIKTLNRLWDYEKREMEQLYNKYLKNF